MFSQYYIVNALQGLNNNTPYRLYYKELCKAQNMTQLNAVFQRLHDKMNVESEDYKENKKALNNAYTTVYTSMLTNQWNNEYLTNFRLCLVSMEKLFDAFKSTDNLVNRVTLDEFKKMLHGLHYNDQVDEKILNHRDRPTSIKKAINFYSIPQSFIQYYHEKIISRSEYEAEYRSQQDACYQHFDELAQEELNIFYEKYYKNVSNYLFSLLTKNCPDSIMLLKSATISREDLVELRDRIRCPSTICIKKDEVCRVAGQMIAEMPETKTNDNDNEIGIVVRTVSKRTSK